jgi:hypothetical protein
MIVQAIQEVLDEPCATVRARISFDKKKGKTTSEAAKDFVRRTCPCEHCQEWRQGRVK